MSVEQTASAVSYKPSKAELAAEIRRDALEYTIRSDISGLLGSAIVRRAQTIEAYLTKGTVPKAKK